MPVKCLKGADELPTILKSAPYAIIDMLTNFSIFTDWLKETLEQL